MARFRFGVGEYKCFRGAAPVVQMLREGLHAAGADREWMDGPAQAGRHKEQVDELYPPTLDGFLGNATPPVRRGRRRCSPYSRAANCLHQDIYGDLAFPLQVVFVLSRAGVDYTGGEFLLVEQRPRAQSRGHAIGVEQGAAVVFATRDRPVAGARGSYRAVMRHGVSTLTSGRRMSLGIIFHDAK